MADRPSDGVARSTRNLITLLGGGSYDLGNLVAAMIDPPHLQEWSRLLDQNELRGSALQRFEITANAARATVLATAKRNTDRALGGRS